MSDQSDLTSLSLENQQFGILQKFVRVLLIYCHHQRNPRLWERWCRCHQKYADWDGNFIEKNMSGQIYFSFVWYMWPILFCPGLRQSGAQEFMTTFIVLFEPKASINSDRYGWYLKWIQSCLISAVTAFFNYDLWSDKTSRRDPLRTPYLNIKTTGDFLSQKNTQITCTICIDSVIWIKWDILRAS